MSIRADMNDIADQAEEVAKAAFDGVAKNEAEAKEIAQAIARIQSACADVWDRIEDQFGRDEIPEGKV
jgi:hypothetical protein